MSLTSRTAIRTSLLLTTPALVAALIIGCGDDDPAEPSPVQTGNVEITTAPALAAPWSLAGPDAYAGQGDGAERIEDLQPGDYTITWGEVDGYEPPEPDSGSLAAGGVLRFVGTYEELGPGTIVVSTEPETLDGPWRIDGPGGFQAEGQGSDVVGGLEAGEYAIAWERLPLYFGPAPLQMDLAAGDTTTFVGTYARIGRELPDFVMSILQDAHTVRSTEAYVDLLSDDFRFVRQGGDPAYGRATEIEIIGRIFAGEAGSGGIVISDIEFSVLRPLGPWQDTPLNDPHFGGSAASLHRPYEIEIGFAIAGQALILRVEGLATFYVRPEQDIPGADHELIGIVDATFGEKAVESTSWAEVRELFR